MQAHNGFEYIRDAGRGSALHSSSPAHIQVPGDAAGPKFRFSVSSIWPVAMSGIPLSLSNPSAAGQFLAISEGWSAYDLLWQVVLSMCSILILCACVVVVIVGLCAAIYGRGRVIRYLTITDGDPVSPSETNRSAGPTTEHMPCAGDRRPGPAHLELDACD